MRIGARIFVVQTGHVADGEQRVGDSVDPCTAVFLCGQRIAQRVDDFALGDAAGRHLPQLLNADAVHLRVVWIFQVEAFDDLLGAGAARAFTENRHFGAKIVPWLEVRFRLTVLVDSFVIRLHADDLVAVEKHLAGGKSSKDGDAGRFHFFRHPLDKLVDGDDIVDRGRAWAAGV